MILSSLEKYDQSTVDVKSFLPLLPLQSGLHLKIQTPAEQNPPLTWHPSTLPV